MSTTVSPETMRSYVRPLRAGETCGWGPHEHHCHCGSLLMSCAEENWLESHPGEAYADEFEVAQWALALTDDDGTVCDHCYFDHR